LATPRIEIQEASGDIAEALHVDEGAEVVIRHQEHFIDDELWSMQTSYYPMALWSEVLRSCPRLRTSQKAPATTSMRRSASRRWARVDTMTVRAPTRGGAERFSLPQDGRVSVLETCQICVAADMKPMRVTITIYPSDRNTFSMETGHLAHPSGGETGS
jgi:GntR family transcriptional regulator